MTFVFAAENPVGKVLGALVIVALAAIASRAVLERAAAATQPETEWCDGAPCEAPPQRPAPPPDPEPVLDPARTCPDTGYLCAHVFDGDSMRVLRWPDAGRTLVVWVPEPSGEDPEYAAAVQRAASRGILRWSGYPMTIRVLERLSASDPTPDITLRWTQSLPEGRLGQARYEWRRDRYETAFRVVDFALVTRSPFDLFERLDSRQVELSAAHEMGHALGLPHSDSERDVMYPENTASALSARDYRSIEALYELPNGALIRPAAR
jgi:hypothetical protein